MNLSRRRTADTLPPATTTRSLHITCVRGARPGTWTVDAYHLATWRPDGIDWTDRVVHRADLVPADAQDTYGRLCAWGPPVAV